VRLRWDRNRGGETRHDLGADVLVLEQNFDIGGKLSHNGGQSSFGGGDPIQERDRLGRPDPDGWLTAPLLPAADMTDDPETLFIDTTDWSVVNDHAVAEYRYNDRALQRGWADNATANPPVPDGQPRSLVAHYGYPPGRRHDQGAGRSFDHEARQQDGHRGGGRSPRQTPAAWRRKDNHSSTPAPAVAPERRPTPLVLLTA